MVFIHLFRIGKVGLTALILCLLGFNALSQDTLSYSRPQELNIDSVALYEGISSIILPAIDSGAFPGCQILLAKGGHIFYEESFGYHTYDSIREVRNKHLYDLASITKVAGTTLALMKLYDDGKIDLDDCLGTYFPYFKNSDKSDLSIRKVLSHQSRLKNWIPFYKESQKSNGEFKPRTFKPDSSKSYPYKVPGANLFMHKDFYEKKILRMIKKSPLYSREEYVYSGLSFYLFPYLVEKEYGISFDQYLYHQFYEPMRTRNLMFQPLSKSTLDWIVPTEIDTFFRMNHLHGVVHDEGAAVMKGGVSGNAGLFGNAHDLAIIFQMLLNKGSYGETKYLTDTTISEFTRYQFADKGNRRGLGFDKPLLEYDSIKSSVAKDASEWSYGHTGYTGTLAWADPQNELIFIFLSNRVYPTRTNKLIYQLNVRPRIHNLVYRLIEEKY